MNNRWFLVFTGVLLSLMGCSGPSHNDDGSDTTQPLQTLTGEVFFRERRYLPPGAELNVTLEDVSKAGAPSTVVATSTTLLAGSQPYKFALDYSPADIDARLQYNLRATITFYDDLLFMSSKRFDPFKHPEDTITLQVTLVGPFEW